MTGRPQHGILVLASCALATALAYALIDRPFAIWSHEHLHGYAIFDRMTLLTGWFPPIAVAIFCATGFAKYLGWRIPKVAVPGRKLGSTIIHRLFGTAPSVSIPCMVA